MRELDYRIERAEPQLYAASPTLALKLRITERLTGGSDPTRIHSIVLRCQVRIEPGRRSYTPAEKERLSDLFGTPERWGQTLRSMLWTHVSMVVPPFEGETLVDLLVPCSYDLTLAATRYFDALEEGELPLCLLFSGTIFYRGDVGALQVAQISWEKEADFRLPASTWRTLLDHYYPNTAWLCLRKDAYDRLDRYRRDHGLPTFEHTLDRLLDSAGEAATP